MILYDADDEVGPAAAEDEDVERNFSLMAALGQVDASCSDNQVHGHRSTEAKGNDRWMEHSVFSSTKMMTKIFVDEAILILIDETKIVTIIQTTSSTLRKRRRKLAYFRGRGDDDDEN